MKKLKYNIDNNIKKEKDNNNYDYFEWLLDFVKRTGGFSTDNLTSNNYKTQKDMINIENFENFFNVISSYCDQYKIPTTIDNPSQWKYHYNVKYKNKGLVVGTAQGLETTYWVNRLEIYEDYTPDMLNDCIALEDIQSNKPYNNTRKLKSKLQKLEEVLTYLKKESISNQEIEKTVKRVLYKK